MTQPTIKTGLLPYTLDSLSPIAQNKTPKKKIDPNKLTSKFGEQYIFSSDIQLTSVL